MEKHLKLAESALVSEQKREPARKKSSRKQ
jgi:hypothetical protein